jgi:hypothetical protein
MVCVQFFGFVLVFSTTDKKTPSNSISQVLLLSCTMASFLLNCAACRSRDWVLGGMYTICLS